MIAFAPLSIAALAIAQAASQPAPLVGGGTARDIGADLTLIFEVGEHQMNVQESWALHNRTGASIAANQVSVPLPKGAKFGRLDERTHGFKINDGFTALDSTEPLPSGDRELT